MRLAPVARAVAAALLSMFVASAVGCSATPPPSPAPPRPSLPAARPRAPGPEDALSDEPMAPDPRITVGKLDNGLTYYVLPHQKPEHRALMWLVVNAGSILEDEDQRGLAHFVEHMGFNGTTRFSKNALVDTLEKMGVSFGADLNASTSFDETVYTLTVPTDKPELVDTSVRVLRDWADGVTFDPVEVDKERGVVLEEWRLRRGAGRRLYDKQASVFYNGSKYADRLTIGLPEIIQKAPRQALVRFYKDWYRPDLMAVVAVGDFDGREVEQKIRAEFKTLAPATSPRRRPTVLPPPHDDVRVSIETDPEATVTEVSILTQRPHHRLASEREYRRVMGERLFTAMLGPRLAEAKGGPDSPFLTTNARTRRYLRVEDGFEVTATTREGGAERGYTRLLEELRRVELHGFIAPELERARANMLRGYEDAVKRRATTDARTFAREMVRSFLEEESMPGPEVELAFAKKVLPTFTIEETNAIARSIADGSRVVAITGPATMKRPSEGALAALAKTVATRDLPAYHENVPSEPLLAKKPTPGRVVATRTIPELDVTEWTLSNGVRVVVKPTDFGGDEVRMSSFALGGTSLAPDADFDSARWAGYLVDQGGLGAHGGLTIRKMLTGKVVSTNAHIRELDEGISGSSASADLETLFQLVHLQFTAPRRDDKAFASFRAREREAATHRLLSPENLFRDELARFTTNDHPRRRPVSLESIDKVDLGKAVEFFKARFGDASGFTFVFVGQLDLERTKTFAETYLGSLPASGKKEAWVDVKVTRPKGVAKKTVTKGAEPKSQVALLFHGGETWTRERENDLRALGEVLRIRLREVLREDMGGVYAVGVAGFIARRPAPEYTFSIAFGCAPDNIDKLEKAVFAEIKVIQKDGVPSDVIDKIKEQRRRAHETNTRQNAYWMSELERAYLFGDDPKVILDADQWTTRVSSDRVKKAARRYLSDKQYLLGELRPAP